MQDMICLGSQEDPALHVSLVFKTLYASRENIKVTVSKNVLNYVCVTLILDYVIHGAEVNFYFERR
jgi:hypothetical protein